MGAYTMTHQTPVGTTLALVLLTGSAAIRPALFEFGISSDATPADVATEFTIDRTTAVGSGGTALDENPLDPLTVAATAAGLGGTFSGAPTVTANSQLWQMALNQRASFRWVAVPGGELIVAAAANNGVVLQSTASGGTANHNFTMMWRE